MLSVPEIIVIAKVSAYLAATDLQKIGAYGSRLDPRLPLIIYGERKAVEWAYNQDTDFEELQKSANYLYALCGKYGLLAQRIIDGAAVGTGVSTTITTGLNFPIRINSSDFDEDGLTYTRAGLDGINYILRSKEFNVAFLSAGNGFTYKTGGGFVITLDGFDASTQEHNILIERVYR